MNGVCQCKSFYIVYLNLEVGFGQDKNIENIF